MVANILLLLYYSQTNKFHIFAVVVQAEVPESNEDQPNILLPEAQKVKEISSKVVRCYFGLLCKCFKCKLLVFAYIIDIFDLMTCYTSHTNNWRALTL